MDTFILYLLKVNAGLVLFYFLYKGLFSKDTFFGWRRAMLLLSYLFSFIYPFIDLTFRVAADSPLATGVGAVYQLILPTLLVTSSTGVSSAAFIELSGWQIVGIVYGLGIIVLLLRTLLEVFQTFRDIRQSEKVVISGVKVCLLQHRQEPYSFFKWICVYPGRYNGAELEEIIRHEQTHIRQRHSLDLLLSQFVTIVCWFNPFLWLLRNEIKINHEYLADRSVIRAGHDKRIYQYHLIGIDRQPKAAASLYNHFNVLPLKKRIKMLNQKRTRNIMKSKYLIFIPVVALLLFFSNCKSDKNQSKESQPPAVVDSTLTKPEATSIEEPKESKKVYDIAEEMPKFPGGLAKLNSYLSENVKYPVEAYEKKIAGKVILQFVVTDDGSISDINVVRSVDPLLDKEAVRVVKSMPKWIPGKQGGKVVNVKYTIPVAFRLQ